MAKKKERTPLQRNGYVSSFDIVGRPVLNENSFQLNCKSERSDWVYNRMNLMIDCGESGSVFCNAMGGFGQERQNVIYVHGKTSDGKDDWKNSYTIDFQDRKDPAVLAEIGSSCFKVVGLQKDTKDKTVYKNYLSEFDMIEDISENLTNDMIVRIRGNMRYQTYNGSTNCQMEVTSIALSTLEEKDFHARFVQTILIDSDCKGDVDKEKGEIDITGYVLEYAREYYGHDVSDPKTKKGVQVPYPYNFKFRIPDQLKTDPGKAKKALARLFGVKKGTITQITMDGEIISQGATVTLGVDDLPDDVKSLIDLGIYTEEEAIATCATNGSRERKMVLLRPRVRNVQNQDGTSYPEVQIMESAWDEEDLNYYLEMASEKIEEMDEDAMNSPEEAEEVEFESVTEDDDSLSWLADL